ncbi:MAG TPA: polyphosphate kinase 2 [Steroidobacteraceae bacterium]|nr:polyphosphate kinase 2 [Steroidobacteraceae bacterium]
MGTAALKADDARLRAVMSEVRQMAAKKGDKGRAAQVKRKDTAPVAGEKREKMKNKEYEEQLKKLQGELVKLQLWVQHRGLRIVVVFEGRDTAGKGGVIKAITERVSPRVFRIVALPAPTEREKSQLYIQRYLTHFPAAGEVILFDRSWYNRAGVERVMGFCSEKEAERFLQLCPVWERGVVNSGITLVKYWLEVSEDEQQRRFESRIADARKIWKLSPMDVKAASRWYDYSRARDDMLLATDTQFAPWHILDSNDQRRGRLNCISHFLSLIPYKEIKREKIKLPKRQKRKGYVDPDRTYKHVPQVY